jgi:hypothetical protein
MTFQKMAADNKILSPCVKNGLQALSKSQKTKVIQKKGSRITCSVDIDDCLKEQCPNQSRWDFGIGVRQKSIFLEIHPAFTGEVKTVLKKLDWLKTWMKNHCKGFSDAEKEYYWLATNKVGILKNSPQHRKIAASGLKGPVSHLKL